MPHAHTQQLGVPPAITAERSGVRREGPTTDAMAEDEASGSVREALDDALTAMRFRMGTDIGVALDSEPVPRVRVPERAIRRLFCEVFGRAFATADDDDAISVQMRRRLDMVAIEFGLPLAAVTRGELGQWTRTCEQLGARLEYGTTSARATLRFEIPSAPEAEPPVRRSRPAPTVDPLRILLIDDDELVRASVARVLASHRVESHGDGEQAIARALAEEFDVILCDLMMPGTSGIDVYRRVCQVRPDLGARFVFISGGAITAEAEAFLSEPGRERLDKPFGSEALREMIERRRPVG